MYPRIPWELVGDPLRERFGKHWSILFPYV